MPHHASEVETQTHTYTDIHAKAILRNQVHTGLQSAHACIIYVVNYTYLYIYIHTYIFIYLSVTIFIIEDASLNAFKPKHMKVMNSSGMDSMHAYIHMYVCMWLPMLYLHNL